MPATYNHFGKVATFDDIQVPVVEAMLNDYLALFRQNVHLDIAKEELEEKLRATENELRELQKLVDLSILHLDPDRQ